MLVSLILIKSVSTGAEICCRFCQALPSDPYRLGCGTVSLTVSYKRTNNVESTLIQPHDIETMLIQHCCVPSGKPFQNIGVGRFRILGRGDGGGGQGLEVDLVMRLLTLRSAPLHQLLGHACPPPPPPPPPPPLPLRLCKTIKKSVLKSLCCCIQTKKMLVLL